MSIQRLDHAKHNHELAEKLHTQGGFPDWVVTTAYYACNHYVRYHLFPLDDHGVDGLEGPVNSFDEYCRFHSCADKHAALCDLFIEKGSNKKIGLSLRLLHNHCRSARYNNYEVDPAIARNAISTMNSVAKICSKKRGKRIRKMAAIPDAPVLPKKARKP